MTGSYIVDVFKLIRHCPHALKVRGQLTPLPRRSHAYRCVLLSPSPRRRVPLSARSPDPVGARRQVVRGYPRDTGVWWFGCTGSQSSIHLGPAASQQRGDIAADETYRDKGGYESLTSQTLRCTETKVGHEPDSKDDETYRDKGETCA